MEKPDLLQNESCGRLDREQAGLQGESPVPPAVMKGPAKKRRLVPAGTADLRADPRVESGMGVETSGVFHSWRLRHLAILLLGVAVIVLVGRPSDAHPPAWPSSWNPYSVSLEDEQGN